MILSDNDKTAAEKELAAKNMRLVIVLALVAVGFYAAIVLVYM